MSPKRKAVLSRREVTDKLVIAWLGMGLTMPAIALNLKRSEKTIEWRWAAIRKRTGLRCYADAARYAMVNGLIPFKV